MSDISTYAFRHPGADGRPGKPAPNAAGDSQRAQPFADVFLGLRQSNLAQQPDLDIRNDEALPITQETAEDEPSASCIAKEAGSESEQDTDATHTTQHLGEIAAPPLVPVASPKDTEAALNAKPVAVPAQRIVLESGNISSTPQPAAAPTTPGNREQAVQTSAFAASQTAQIRTTGHNPASENRSALTPSTPIQSNEPSAIRQTPQIVTPPESQTTAQTSQLRAEPMVPSQFSRFGALNTDKARARQSQADAPAPKLASGTERQPPAPVAPQSSSGAAIPPPLSQPSPRATLDSAIEVTEEFTLSTSHSIRESGGHTGALSASQTFGRTDLARHVALQISSAASAQSGGQVVLRLNPEELGHVRLTMTPGEGTMLVSIVAERGETLDLMRRHINLLAEEFQALGYDDPQFDFKNPQRDGNGSSPTSPDDDSPPLIHPDDSPTSIAQAPSAPHDSGGLDLRF